MGLLSEGSPLSWEETKYYSNHVREHGILQFINHFAQLKVREGDCLKWGDEVEYMIVKLDKESKKVKLCLKGSWLLTKLQEAEKNNPKEVQSLWRPEYAEYMVEGTPGQPYGWLAQHLNTVEKNMLFRRNELQGLLAEDELALSLTSFPSLGCKGFCDPPALPNPINGVSRSLYFPDEAITQCHPRFKTLTQNIRERRGEKVAVNVPIYKDVNTPDPFIDGNTLPEGGEINHIHMDAMGFGMGCSCLQMTFQACNIIEARILYDQLTPLCPIMLALSASSPIYKGYLSAVDCRWDVISASVDCRTKEERGLEPLKNNSFVIPKSRYSSVDCYISESGEQCNDLKFIYDLNIYNKLLENNVDNLLAQHIAHLFIRDSVSLFSEQIHQDDTKELDHFENIQSTNWQTMRFKVPPPNSNIGWRVEFRPCEVQFTDFENAAYSVFIVLLTRCILSYNLNMLIPISKVDENMVRAQKQNAVMEQKMWFRKDIFSKGCKVSYDAVEMSIDEIINGKEGTFVGLISVIKDYVSAMDVDADTACTIHQYLKLISSRANGTCWTAATWIRKFVTAHPDYKQDSVVSDLVSYDMVHDISDITFERLHCVQLLGNKPISRTTDKVPPIIRKRFQPSVSEWCMYEKQNDEQENHC